MNQGSKIVCLTGGLGNQIFQFAAAREIFGNFDFTLEWKLGITNLNKDLLPEICDYMLPASVEIGSFIEPNSVSSKLTHLVLRRSSSNKHFPGKFVFTLVEQTLSISLLGYLRRYHKVIFPRDLDSTVVKSKRARNEFLFGFFHSNNFVSSSENLESLRVMKPITIDPYLDILQKESTVENPVVVHIRLGDYVKEVAFGILPTDYYEKALDLLALSMDMKYIWVFSNDLARAKEIFPSKYKDRVRWIPDFSNSSVQVLEAMRLGHGYVLGNSTFSWWAARLSLSTAPLIVVPDPWFKSAETNSTLIPINWLPVSAWD